MIHPMDVIDTAGERPDEADERQEFTQRLRAVG
jgi:hypothetical protein